MNQVKLGRSGSWCLPRPFTQDPPRTRKRKADKAAVSEAALLEPSDLPGTLLSQHAKKGLTSAHAEPEDFAGEFRNWAEDEDEEPIYDNYGHIDDKETGNAAHVHQHHAPGPDKLTIYDSSDPAGKYAFRIPPQSSLSLSSCAWVRNFHARLRIQAEVLDIEPIFEFILFDPPWPNSSVKRTHKTPNSTYNLSDSLLDIESLVAGIRLSLLTTETTLVGVWITNSPAVRHQVLGEGGIFDIWELDLVEEWIWLKTTSAGQPVTPLDGVWRKPYEVLLLGRKKKEFMVAGRKTPLMRRVIFGVPDLHSRKPCLKRLIEPLMPDASKYRALEVFARHLVAGWWSWGDECIKFNWEEYWREKEPRQK